MFATEDSLANTRWECKYHIVFIPKYRRKAIFAKLRPALGEVLRELVRRSVKSWKVIWEFILKQERRDQREARQLGLGL